MITECSNIPFGILEFSSVRMELAKKKMGKPSNCIYLDITSISTEKQMNSAFQYAQNSVSFHFLAYLLYIIWLKYTLCFSTVSVCHVRTSEYTVYMYPVYPKPNIPIFLMLLEAEERPEWKKLPYWPPKTFSHRCYRRFPRRILLSVKAGARFLL